MLREVFEETHHIFRDGADGTVTDLLAVDTNDGNDVFIGGGEKDFIGGAEFGFGDGPFLDREIFLREVEYEIARGTDENIIFGCENNAVFHDEEIARRGFEDVVVLDEDDFERIFLYPDLLMLDSGDVIGDLGDREVAVI